MASKRIKGITIQLGLDATDLNKKLKDIDSSLKDTQTQLRDVNKLLKLDPSNTELLRQKQDLLGKAVGDSKKRLDELNNALKQMESAPNADQTIDQQNALKREIIETQHSLEEYEKQLKNCNPALESFAAKSADVAEKTKGLSTAAAGIAGALVGNAVAAAGAADDLNALSQQTGFSVEELQKMQYASDVVDVSMDQMTGSIQKMTKQMSSGNSAFEELGVSIYDANGNMRDASDVWHDSIKALSEIDNETQRDALSMEIFGKSAMDMAGIIDDGGESLNALGQEAEDLGLIMGQDMVDDANELQDAIDKMKGRTQQAFLTMGSSLAKTLVPAFDKLMKIVTKVVTWFSNLSGGTQKVILIIAGLVAAISPLATAFSKITTIVSGVSSALTFFASPVGIAVAAIGGLIAVGVALYKNWDTIKAKASELWSSISGTFENIRRTISDKIEGAKQAVSNAVERIKGIFNFKWTWPKISTPHFRVNGSLNPINWLRDGLPNISVDWYAKAMKNGMILNNPTIFGYADGKFLGGGEAGSETIVGTNSLMRMISAASKGTTINMTINATDQNVYQLADLVSERLTRQLQRERLVFK